jgi:uncharacterized protein YjiS (DUF1127 family)
MSTSIYETHTGPDAGTADCGPRSPGFFVRCFRRLGRYLRDRQTRQDLHDLDDRMLNDVGIPREGARRIAGTSFWP